MGRNKPRQKTTNTSLCKASTLFRVRVWQIRKMLPPTSWYFIQFMQMRQERDRDRLLCSVHSYQQISKRPSSQRLIIPPFLSLYECKLNLAKSWKIWNSNTFCCFFCARIICRRDILLAPHWVWLICTWWELETAGLERLSRWGLHCPLSSVQCIGDFSAQCLHKCLSCWVNTQSKRVATTTTREGVEIERQRERGDNATL